MIDRKLNQRLLAMALAVALGGGVYATASADTIVWTAAANSTWDTTSIDWTADSGGRNDGKFATGDNVTFTNTGAGAITIAAGGVSPGSVAINATISYNFSSTTAGINGGGGLTKVGTGDLTLAANNGYTGATSITGGNLLMNNVTGQLSGTSALTLNDATINLGVSTNTNQPNTYINNSAAITLAGGTITLRNSASSSSGTTETVGALTLNAGSNAIGLTKGNKDITLAFSGLTARNAGATLLNTSTAVGTTKVTFTASPTLQNGILPYALVQASTGVMEFGTMSGTTLAPYSSYTLFNTSGGALASDSTKNYKVQTGSVVQNSNADANSLFLDGTTAGGDVNITGSSTISLTGTIASAIRSLGAGNNSISAPISFGGEAVIFNDNQLTLNGTLTGSAGLTKDRAGTLILAADNSATFSGPIYINAGTLSISADNNLGSASGTLNIGKGVLSSTGASVTMSRAVTLNSSSSASGIDVASGGTLNLSGAVTANGVSGLNKTGGGNLILSGTGKIGTNNGAAININAGTLTLDNSTNNVADRVNNTSAVNLAVNTRLVYKGNGAADSSETIGVLTLDGTAGGTPIITIDANGGTNSAQLTAASYNRTAGLVLVRGSNLGSTPGAGVGSLFLTTTPTLLGAGALNTDTRGVMLVTFGSTSTTGTYEGFTTYDPATGVRLLNASEQSSTLGASKNVKLSSSVSNTTNVAINTLQLSSGGAITQPSGTPALTISGGIFVASGANSTVTQSTIAMGTVPFFVTVGDLTTSANVTTSGTTTAYQKYGAGTWTLSGAGLGTAATVNVYEGSLKLAGSSKIADTSTVNIASGATFDLNGFTDQIGGLSGAGTVTGGSGSTGEVRINQTGTLTVNHKFTGNLNVAQRGAGTLIIAGTTNDYTGFTQTQAGGTIKIGANNALPTGTDVQLGNASDTGAGTFDLNNFNQTIGKLTRNTTGTATVTNSGASLRTLTISSNTVDSSYNGVISGTNFALAKAGTKTLTLAGNNTYAGGTTISNGTVIANHNSALGSGGVTINGGTLNVATGITLGNSISFGGSGGTLAGVGTVTSAVTLGSNAVLAPGSSPGTLTVDNADLTWATGGTYSWQILDAAGVAGTGWDLVNVTGTGTLAVTATSGGKFNVVLQSLASIGPDTQGVAQNFNALVNQNWKIAASANAITGWDVADGLASNLFTINATNFVGADPIGTFFVSKTGNDVFLNYAVPEPASLVLLGLGGLLMLPRQRRRQA